MSGFLGKYSRILVAVFVFLLLVLSVLGLNFYNSFRIQKDAQLVDSIGEQGALSQRISKSLLQTFNAYTSGEDYSGSLSELVNSSGSFDTQLSSLQSNSNLRDLNNSNVKDTSIVWQPLFTRINTIEQRLAEEKELVDNEKTTVRSSLARLDNTSRVSTLVLEKLITELAGARLKAQGADSAFQIEKDAVLAIKLEELVLITQNRYFKGLDINKIVNRMDVIVDSLTQTINNYRASINRNQSSALTNDFVTQSELVDEIDILWAPLKSDAKTFFKAIEDNSGRSSIPSLFLDALSYSNTNMNGISNKMDSLVGEVGSVINKSADSSRLIQLLGIVGSSLCFLYILGAVFGRLRQSDAEVEVAQRESKQIFETIDQGVFLLNENAVIGSQHSKELLNIFGSESVANKELLKFLKDIVSEEDLEKLSRYIKLLFDPHKKEKLIQDLNPLSEVATQIFQDGRMVTKHLRFNFSRVISDKKVESILTSVSDISNEIKLREKLENESRRGDQQMNLLATLLNTDPKLLPMFIEDSENIYTEINEVLRSDSRTTYDYHEKAGELGVLIHKVKGESSALSIDSVTETCEEFESALVKIKNDRQIGGNSFLPLTILLERLIVFNKLIGELNDRVFSKKTEKFKGASQADAKPLDYSQKWLQLFDFTKKLAQRANKKVQLRYSGLDSEGLSSQLSAELSVLASQFLRNAVSHGIESEAERVKRGKSKTGQISLSLYRQDEGFVFECYDDGQGIDVKALATRAVEQGYLTKEEFAAMPESKLISLIFRQGFSSKDTVSEDSGRGFGMSAIHDVVKKLDGSISISTQVGDFTRFSIHFPDKNRSAKSA